MDLPLLGIIQLSPLLAFVFIWLLPKKVKGWAAGLALSASLAAALASVCLFWEHRNGQNLPLEWALTWLPITDGYALKAGFLLDPLNLFMIVLVTTICFFIQLFSVYYMAEDPCKVRYFSFLSFFGFAMTGLVLSQNLLQTFFFWELVGLASYLLIGFWYERPQAAQAARKAFVLNRLGDLGFYLGVILLFLFFGSLDFLHLESQALQSALPSWLLTGLGLLILTGVMGKSAQFPFHVWLPDAMEGPTPVSALIHSATMVAAGVFLLARAFGIFSASAAVLFTTLVIGCLTALLGAMLATLQRDIKRILAYSTISQLGFMVMAIGAGSTAAGLFHLGTHAYFKSLLFLTAGVFIHELHTNDIWEIGQKGGKKNLLAMGALGLGLFSLSGIFPFSGFFSKDRILEVLSEKSAFFFTLAVLVSFLTVYYSFRLFFVILFSKITQTTTERTHEPGVLKASRVLPLFFLAALSLYAGAQGAHSHSPKPEILVVTAFVILGGSGLALFHFRNAQEAEAQLASDRNFLKILLERKFFMDDAYEFLVKKIALKLAGLLERFDKGVISGVMVNETAKSIGRLGRLISKVQNGLLQDYLSWALAVAAFILFWMMRPWP